MRISFATFFIFFLFICCVEMIHALEYQMGPVSVAINGYVEGKGVYILNKETPSENPSGKVDIHLKSDFASWGDFYLAFQGIYNGKVKEPQNHEIFCEFNKVYQDKNPYVNIDEAYVDIFVKKVDLRAGIQKIAWGKLDEINPTDNLNTEDLTQAKMNKENERKIGVPAIKGDFYSDLLNAELVWIPQYVPYRLAKPGERWYPSVLRPPQFIQTQTPAGDIPVQYDYREMDLPPFALENSEVGVQLSKQLAGLDVSLNYFSGYDNTPVFGYPTEIVVDFSIIPLTYDVMAKIHAEPRVHKLQVFGFDFSTVLGSFTLRGEGAYFKGKYYCRKTQDVLGEEITQEKYNEILAAFIKEFLRSGQTKQIFYRDPKVELQMDSAKYGLGVDYIYGSTVLSLQCIQEYIFDYDITKPVYFSKDGFDTNFTFSVKRLFRQDTLEVQFDGLYDIEFEDMLLKPSITYHFTDRLQGTLGAIFIQAKFNDSLLGQYRDNDEIYVKMRYSF